MYCNVQNLQLYILLIIESAKVCTQTKSPFSHSYDSKSYNRRVKFYQNSTYIKIFCVEQNSVIKLKIRNLNLCIGVPQVPKLYIIKTNEVYALGLSAIIFTFQFFQNVRRVSRTISTGGLHSSAQVMWKQGCQ